MGVLWNWKALDNYRWNGRNRKERGCKHVHMKETFAFEILPAIYIDICDFVITEKTLAHLLVKSRGP